MKLIDVIAQWIPGDWGNEQTSAEAPVAVHCIRSADIAPIYQYSFDTAVIRYISEKSLSKCQLSEGDIIVEKSGGTDTCSTGRVIFVTKEILEKNTPLVCSNFCSAFKVKDGWNAKYIYYYLQLIHKSGVFHNFEGKTSGIHNLLINAAYSSIDIPEISYTEQCRIVDVLSTIESEITLNHCINKQLEQTARDLYDYWFLQFDFPDANGNPYRTSGGAMTYDATLKREIPVGWEVCPLKKMAEIKSGFPFKSESYLPEGKYRIITIKNVQNRGLDISNTDFINEMPDKLPEYCNLRLGDFLISLTGNVGRVGYVYSDNLLLNQRVGVIVDKIGHPIWNGMSYQNASIFKTIQYLANGCAQANVSPIMIGEIQSIRPAEDVLIKFDAQVQPIYEQLIANGKETLHLIELRDQLLPLLMNGQVTIE